METPSGTLPQEPSRKQTTLFIVAALTLLVVTSFLPASWFGIKPVSNHTPLDIAALEKSISLREDSDQNGVPDWQDLLSEESSTLIFEGNTETLSSPSYLDDPTNLTSSFAKNIFTVQAYINENGITDPDTQQILAGQAVIDEAKKIVSKKYTTLDIKILDNPSPATIKSYGNQLGGLVKQAIASSFGQGDITSLNSYLETQNVSDLYVLQDKAAQVSDFITTLRTIPAPRGASTYHILTLNRLEEYKDILLSMSQADKDPLRALIGLQTYQDSQNKLFSAVEQFRTYFTDQNIVFKSSENGYFFTSGYTQ